MSIFDNDIIERPLHVRDGFDIRIEEFNRHCFYTWVWEKKGIHCSGGHPVGVTLQTLTDAVTDTLGDLSVDNFEKWITEAQIGGPKIGAAKHAIKYFKKLIKREYWRSLGAFVENGIFEFYVRDDAFDAWALRSALPIMRIIFYRK
jgi:hypothetical protein